MFRQSIFCDTPLGNRFKGFSSIKTIHLLHSNGSAGIWTADLHLHFWDVLSITLPSLRLCMQKRVVLGHYDISLRGFNWCSKCHKFKMQSERLSMEQTWDFSRRFTTVHAVPYTTEPSLTLVSLTVKIKSATLLARRLSRRHSVNQLYGITILLKLKHCLFLNGPFPPILYITVPIFTGRLNFDGPHWPLPEMTTACCPPKTRTPVLSGKL